VFDLLDEEDAGEWYYGHDCEDELSLAPIESPQARHALVETYKALKVLDESGLLDFIEEAITAIETSMSPNLACTILPTYTKVRFQTDRSRDDEFIEGQLREGAWGLNPERGQQALERRITTTSGFEFFVTPETVFTYFEIVELGANS
jgi:hypothetical protein